MSASSRLLRAVLAAAAAASMAGCALMSPTGVSATAAETRLTATATPAPTCRADGRTLPQVARRTSDFSSLVPFGSDGDQPLVGRLRIPAAGPSVALPVVLVVHGGGWMHGDMSEMYPAVQALNAAGFATFNIDYGLATSSSPGFPRELDDVAQAVRYLRSHAVGYGLDPNRIGAVGSSAGANLVSLLATSGRGSCSSGSRVAAVVSWSAPFDVADYGATGAAGCEVTMAACRHLAAEAGAYIGCDYRSCPDTWRQASVAPQVSSDDPPMLLFTSSRELIPAEQAEDMAAALQRHGVPHQLVVFPGGRHAASYAGWALPLTVEFLRHYLEPALP